MLLCKVNMSQFMNLEDRYSEFFDLKDILLRSLDK
jgi:hypothetical protein